MQPARREAVVTGIGVVSPMGVSSCDGRDLGLDKFWSGLIAGRDTAGPIRAFDTSAYPTHIACETLFEPDPARPDEARWLAFLDRAYQDAVVDAGINPASANTALYVGTVLGGVIEGQKAWAANAPLPPSYHLRSGIDTLKTRYNISGPSMTLSTACASGTDAIGMAMRAIRSNKANVAVAGGVDTLSEFAFSGFNSLRALSKTAIRPFDKDRDGLVLGEGACILVLEEANAATRRGAKIYGAVMGYASRADGRHLTAPDRDGRGLASAITAALADADVTDIDYINAHGTGTLYNDAMETRAIKLAFGDAAREIPVSSIKSMIGHSFGAGGALEAAACLLAIRDGIMPPTIHYSTPDPDCDLDCIPNTARRGRVKTSLSLSAGFGGQNAAIIFGERT
ncbi:MAG: beta-ketoacyl-[acyl-carrier-protein] synthase family protein [Deltaproteobacteria bacterium]|nr:beta-ketoacyl-[acyl-carrier-protein] synthase family protein [Deltaproteobacteria bacterium]